MVRRSRFTHGKTGQRLKKLGYRWSACAENFARDEGRPPPETTFKGWMRTSSHRPNILDRRLDEDGIGAPQETPTAREHRVDRGSPNPPPI